MMPEAIFQFPAGFLWGTATSAHQVEGNNKNNSWWKWESEPGRIRQGHTSGVACDWWGGRWKEDLERAQAAGQNAHRFSVEWSRIQPSPERWDDDALDHYRQMLLFMHQHEMTPMVTLHHFTDPLWLMEMGGWESEAVPRLFQKYARRVAEALGDLVKLWTPINEPNVYMFSGYFEGTFPPGKRDSKSGFTALTNMVKAHAAAYDAIHEVQPEAEVGISIHYRSLQPQSSWSPLDKWIAGVQWHAFNDAFPLAFATGTLKLLNMQAAIPEAVDRMDFTGVQYYTRELVTFILDPRNTFGRRTFPEDAARSTTGFIADVPAGMFEALKWAKAFRKPIYVTENGVEDEDDSLRPRYIVEHIHQTWRAANFNYRIKGYFYWSLVDNFEWERGWTQRFGLWGLDVETQQRIHRRSVDVYAAICRDNGISSQMVGSLVPEIFSKLFPG